MKMARVIGHVVSTVKDPRHEGFKLLLVQPVDEQAKPWGDGLLVIDGAQAGVGDYVLVIEEGKSARAIMGSADAPCEAIAVGVIDSVMVAGKQHVLREEVERA